VIKHEKNIFFARDNLTSRKKTLGKIKMQLRAIDAHEIIPAFGLPNYGATCYLNSLIQCLLSCTALFDKTSTLRGELFEELKKIRDRRATPESLWNKLLKIASKRSDHVKFSRGQQDANEGFHLLADNMLGIDDYFRLHVNNKIVCSKCGFVKIIRHSDYFFKISHLPEGGSLNNFVRKHQAIVESYRCEKCGDDSRKVQTTSLSFIPTVFVVLFEKYSGKKKIDYPKFLYFPTAKKKFIKHVLVATSEHSGSMDGGHYWANCLRREGWVNLNDSNVSKIKSEINSSTYLCFYHFHSITDVVPT
jgi:ubiquitin C-terminal hydrolase